jgi:hypothetical protein
MTAGVEELPQAAGVEELPEAELAEQFRRVNEGIHRTGDGVFLCECLRADCNALVELGADEYEAIRACPSRFFVLPGHELADLDAVIEHHEGYLIVRRGGESFTVADTRPAPPA